MSSRGHKVIDTVVRFGWLLWLIASYAGCATSQEKPPPPPPVLATARAGTPVGGVNPVFIEVLAGGQSAASIGLAAGRSVAVAYREDICAEAQNQGGCVPALDLEDAGRMAGGLEKLAAALARDEGAASAVSRSVLLPSVEGVAAGWEAGSKIGGEGGAAVAMLVTTAGLITGVARGAYLTATPEARYLDQVAAHSLGSRVKWNWYAPQSGFVCFPAGKYRRIRIVFETGKSIATLWPEWPEGTEKTFDIQPLESKSPLPSSGSSLSPTGETLVQ
jgi:hypothetical protein